MKKYVLILALISMFALGCIGQMFVFPWSSSALSVAQPPHPATYDLEYLASIIQRPEGARGSGTSESYRLVGIGHDTSGFFGTLWINTSDMQWPPRQNQHRGERVAAIAGFYASQIADYVPGARVVGAVDGNLVEADSLHATFLVWHPDGHIVVSAGYKSVPDNQQRVGETVKVHVISHNPDGKVRLRAGVPDLLVPASD